MPIYEYRCESCTSVTEVWAKISDPPPASCPTCGTEGQMEKLISRSAFHLKGGGWYAQGYEGGKGGSSSGASSSSDSSSSSGSSDSGSSGSGSSGTSSSSSSGSSSSSD